MKAEIREIPPTTVTVVVLSYNRPRMLAEALESIIGADEIVVVDDGSSFDVEKVIKDSLPPIVPFKVVLEKKPPLTPEERIVTARVGKNMNEAIRNAQSDVITYLCDDDIFAPGWIQGIKDYYDGPGVKQHWIRGWWGQFIDPHNPLKHSDDPMKHIRTNICPMAPHGLTTGSFAHLRRCSIKCDVWWSEKSVSIHDSYFVGNYIKAHGSDHVPLLEGCPAGWRREHPFNMMKHVLGSDQYQESGKRLIREGEMLE